MNAFDYLFRDRHTGEATVFQPANAPITIVAGSAAVHWLFPDDRAGAVAGTVSCLALGWWATDELLRGVNPYRRLTGAATLVFLGLRLLR